MLEIREERRKARNQNPRVFQARAQTRFERPSVLKRRGPKTECCVSGNTSDLRSRRVHCIVSLRTFLLGRGNLAARVLLLFPRERIRSNFRVEKLSLAREVWATKSGRWKYSRKKNNQTNRLNSGLRFYEVTLTEEGEGDEEVVPRERSLAKMLNMPIS